MFCLAKSNKISQDESPERIFRSNSYLEELWSKHQKFIENFILRIVDIYDCNFHGICGWSRNFGRIHTAEMIGVGCFSFASLINHSCYPNVNRIYRNDKMLIVVDRPIKKGEQIFDCYR
jgi:SET domain-containing protein